MKLRRLVIVPIAALALGFAGCGDDTGDDDDDIDAPTGNAAPTAAFTMSPDCTSSATDEVTFTSESTDPDGDTLTCSWTFASGSPGSATECTVTGVTFPNVSPYTVTLTVDDGNGGTDTTSMSIAPC